MYGTLIIAILGVSLKMGLLNHMFSKICTSCARKPIQGHFYILREKMTQYCPHKLAKLDTTSKVKHQNKQKRQKSPFFSISFQPSKSGGLIG